MDNSKLAKLAKAAQAASESAKFTPSTFIRTSKGTRRAVGTVSVNHPARTWFSDETSVDAGNWIVKHLDEYIDALLAADDLAKRPGELARLEAAAKARAKAKEEKAAAAAEAKAAPKLRSKQQELDERIAATENEA